MVQINYKFLMQLTHPQNYHNKSVGMLPMNLVGEKKKKLKLRGIYHLLKAAWILRSGILTTSSLQLYHHTRHKHGHKEPKKKKKKSDMEFFAYL